MLLRTVFTSLKRSSGIGYSLSGTTKNLRAMSTSSERSSRISGFHNLAIPERIEKLRENGFLNDESAAALRGEGLKVNDASNMVENVVSTFGMPMGIALNIVVNGRDYAVPMVVEEPSVVAAVSNVARLARPEGFIAESDPPVMIGQIQILDTADIAAAAKALQNAIPSLAEQANAMHPNLIRRGGGVRGMEVRKLVYDEPGESRSYPLHSSTHPSPEPHAFCAPRRPKPAQTRSRSCATPSAPRSARSLGVLPEGAIPRERPRREESLVLNFFMDCRDAMGANMINTTAERLAPEAASPPQHRPPARSTQPPRLFPGLSCPLRPPLP